MNIMELGAIGELVGGVAVIASLIYVGLQVCGINDDGAPFSPRPPNFRPQLPLPGQWAGR
jgi:hypothetical protein